MISEFEFLVLRYQVMPPDAVAISIAQIQAEMIDLQQRLAAARKAQKKQKRAAKKHSDAKAS